MPTKTESSSSSTSAQPSRPPLPVDRGWTWMITLGAFVNTVFAFSFIRSLSIFFIEFLDRFQQSATMTTLSFGLNTVAFSASALAVPPLLLSRFSVKSVSVVGALINALSIIGLAFCPNMTWISVMFVAIGLAHPLIFISQVALLGVYCKRRLSLAVACANLGLSVGVMCGPPFTQYLLDTYGLAGALLIHGGLNLNNVAACLLFRSPDVYSTPMESPADGTSTLRSPINGSECQMSNESLNCKLKGKNGCTPREKCDVLLKKTDEQENEHSVDRKNTDCNISNKNPRLKLLKQEDVPRSNSLISLNGNSNRKSDINPARGRYHTGSERNIAPSRMSLSDLFTSGSKLTIIDVISSSTSLRYLSHSSLCLDRILLTMPRETNDSPSVLHKSQILTVEKVERISLVNASPDQDHEFFLESESTKRTTEVKNVSCYHPVKVLLLLMAGLGVNTQCAAAYMPSLGQEQGLLREHLPFLMTIIGAADLFKLAIGHLADQGWVRRIHIVLVCQLIMGVTFQFTSFFQGLVPMIILCVIFGANTGVLHVLLPGITADLLGPKYIGQIMSFYFLINGVVMSLTHILVGSLKDETGSFIGGYHFIGGLILVSGFIILLEPVAKSCSPPDFEG